MTTLEAIAAAKTFRKDADELLQRMKEHARFTEMHQILDAEDDTSIARHHSLSIIAIEDCIMRQGMVLKSIGNPTPYPNSYNPDSPVVDATADGLKL